MQEVFNLFVGYPACHSERSEESRIIWSSAAESDPEMFRFAQHDKPRARTDIAAGTAASTVNR
jgi:hypothetical protein